MNLSHFLTLLTFTNDKWHTILHIKDLEDATPKSKMKQKIRQMFQTKRAKIICLNSILLHFHCTCLYQWQTAQVLLVLAGSGQIWLALPSHVCPDCTLVTAHLCNCNYNCNQVFYTKCNCHCICIPRSYSYHFLAQTWVHRLGWSWQAVV